MKILYTTASRLGGTGLSKVAYHAVRSIYNHGWLEKALTAGNRQSDVPSHMLKRFWFQPPKLFSFLSSRYYYTMKRVWFDYRAAGYVRSNPTDIVHGWTHESLQTVHAAREVGAISLVDRGYAHPRFSKRILDEEYEIYGIPRNLEAAPPWLRPYDHWRRELDEAVEEMEQCDYLLVPSQFCYDSCLLEGIPASRLMMIPRGFDPTMFKPVEPEDERFRVVFVGLLAVRKGLKYLLEAWERLALVNAELLLVGSLHQELVPMLTPYLQREDVNHIAFTPNPAEFYNKATVFVFPSLDEGSAKVTYEAMACGLPVITTPNSGSLVRDGLDGFLVAPRSVDELMEKILYYYDDRDAARQMGQSAWQAIQAYTWDNYEERLANFYEKIMAK
ncbi:MAG: glycosyltransferase family 4 protein [Magnetococcales bacterium]|nr:glycosyltransferase family 4 protein [Magnetococcales bacterium]